jgi:ATP-dependent Clp protease ATP-binding subunit ClpA
MTLLAKLKARLRDVKTIKVLCERADAYALADHQREPGAEHFLLAALELPDGTARAAFQAIGADSHALQIAIADQYAEALRTVGMSPEGPALALPAASPPKPKKIYNASPSGQEIMQALARQSHQPLSGAQVVAAVASMRYGIASRALRSMMIDREKLREAAEALASSSKA